MHLKATRGSFGDFGRVRKGQILKDVDKSLAEKLVKSGAYAEASEQDIKDAKGRKELGILDAKKIAAAAKSDTADTDALLAEIEAGEKALTASKAATETAVRELADFKADSETMLTNANKATSDAVSALDAYKSEAEGKLAEIVKASEGVTAEFAAYKTEAEAKLTASSDEIAGLKAAIADRQQAASQSAKTDDDKSKGKSEK